MSAFSYNNFFTNSGYDGNHNTDVIIDTLGTGNAPAAEYCRSKSISIEGKTVYGYIPAREEWDEAYDCKEEVNACISLIGGTAIATDIYHWSSKSRATNTMWCVD